jgi:uncharacterized protein (UPF0335 family)
MIKHAYSVQMSYDITNEEKATAERALLIFNATNSLLDKAYDYLNVIYNPFSKDSAIDSDQIYQYRAALRKYRDNVVNKFNKFKVGSFKCVKTMSAFASDTQTIKLIKSFTNSIEELESKVNSFVDLFDDLKSKDFAANIVKEVDSIRKKCEEISSLIDERIKNHIKNNILSKSWVNNVGDELQMKIEKKTPLMIELYKKREKELRGEK